jgi:hypothetical protein
MTRRDVGRLCIFTTQTALRENAQPYRFWGLLDSCLAANDFIAFFNLLQQLRQACFGFVDIDSLRH